MEPDALTNAPPSAQKTIGASPAEGGDDKPLLIPDHQLLRRIGRGSYGTVWLARNMMGMYRAVKIIYRKSFDNQRPFERELSGIRKFEPISRSHEGFIDVLHVGINETEGYFYYVMELGDDQISGQSIDPERYSPKMLGREISLRGRLSFPECLQLGLALSQALAELHKHGLVHRDVKPSNIIFVHGVPKLADIGLVANIDEARSYVGTEGFIPPEGPGRPQADVYSLGKVLYEASTGKDRQEFPELPTRLDEFSDPGGFLELNEVILHACRNDAEARYQSAWEMHTDLLVIANGKSVKRLKLLERRLANLKRVAGISALVLVVLAGILYQGYREWRRTIESRQRQVGVNVAYGNRSMEAGDFLGALPYFAEALRLGKQNLKQEAADRLRFGSALAQCPKLTHLWFTGKLVQDGEFSPDGKRIVIAQAFGKAEIYDLESQQLFSHPFGQEQLISAAFSPDGRFVATGNEHSASIWDARTLTEVLRLPHTDWVLNARFSPDGLRVITAGMDGLARVWDARTGRLQLQIKQHAKGVVFADFSHDGRLIVTTGYDATACLWDALDGHSLGPPLMHGSWVKYAAFSPDDQRLVTACFDRSARVWEVATGRRILPDLKHRDGIESAKFSPDGRLILTASFDGTARLWRADDLQPLSSNPVLKHNERVIHAAFSSDSRRILTTCADGSVRIWVSGGSSVAPVSGRYSLSQDGSRYLTFTNKGLEIRDAASGNATSLPITIDLSPEKADFSRNGRFVLSTSITQTNANATNRFLQVWDAGTGKAIAPGLSITNPLAGASLSDDGERLVTFGGDIARIWDVQSRRMVSLPLLHKQPVRLAVFSRDGSRLATVSGDEVHVWDASQGRALFVPLKHPVPAAYAEFSPDGILLASCCTDPQLTKCFAQVWNAATGQPVGPQLKHGDGVLFVSFGPDGRRIVTASEDFTARIWDATTGLQIAPVLNHEDQVQTAAFSPDGKWIVTASSDKTARVWNAETGDPLTPPLRHIAKLGSARFLGDGRRIMTWDKMGHAWIWNLPLDERPADNLRMLARLLAVESPAKQSESLETIWEQLHNRYPSDFAASVGEIEAWHEFEAEDSAMEKQWFAVAFHLKQLLSLQPNDPSLLERLARANEQLHSKN